MQQSLDYKVQENNTNTGQKQKNHLCLLARQEEQTQHREEYKTIKINAKLG